MIAWWTGGAWVLYFADAPTLVRDLATFQAPFVAYLWIAILTATTYTFAGHAREQVCIYMCPWPRIQAALTDEWALNVTYRRDRGEPRVSVKKAEQLRLAGEPAGDCIDCHQCINVCPTGVDIREGIQLGCIQCGLCIDACDNIMKEIGRPTGLIAYDTDINGQRRQAGKPPIYRLIRARTILYAAIIAAVGGLMLYALATRSPIDLSVLHDRNPLFVLLSDGGVRNNYMVRILNKGERRTFALDVSGLPGAQLHSPGIEPRADGKIAVDVGQDQTREVRLSVQVSSGMVPSNPVRIDIRATDATTGLATAAADHFVPPAQ
jgi:cytochrome c oxidase accessory protein FixG